MCPQKKQPLGVRLSSPRLSAFAYAAEQPLSDTHPRITAKHIELLRSAGSAQRIQRTRSLSSSVIQLSRAGLAKAYPEWNEAQVLLAWVGLCYGEELAAGLGKFLDRTRE